MAARAQLSEAEAAALLIRKGINERRAGTIISLIGGGILAVILLTLIGGGLLISAADSARRSGASIEVLETLRPALELGVLLVPAILVLFALTGLVLGEQVRRGSLALSSLENSPVRSTGSIVSRFGALSYGWHALWAVLGLIVSGFLVGAPAASWVTGAWPYSDPSGGDFGQSWVIYGALGFGASAAALVSLLKKAVWAGVMARHPDRLDSGESNRLWRWITYRWRFDLWLAGIGGTLVAFSVTLLPYVADDDGASTAFVAMVAGGLLLVALGAVLATQYWRAGERIGRGESII